MVILILFFMQIYSLFCCVICINIRSLLGENAVVADDVWCVAVSTDNARLGVSACITAVCTFSYRYHYLSGFVGQYVLYCRKASSASQTMLVRASEQAVPEHETARSAFFFHPGDVQNEYS